VAEEKPPAPPDFPFLVAAGIAIAATLVLARNLLPVKRDLADSARREEVLKKEIEALRAERDLLEMREKALTDDPRFIERSVRAPTGMTRPEEYLVR
jgi:cell division protein FtsB